MSGDLVELMGFGNINQSLQVGFTQMYTGERQEEPEFVFESAYYGFYTGKKARVIDYTKMIKFDEEGEYLD